MSYRTIANVTRHVEHHLHFRAGSTRDDDAITSESCLPLIADVDRFVWAVLQDNLPPYAIKVEQCWGKYVRLAEPNPLSPAAKLVDRFFAILGRVSGTIFLDQLFEFAPHISLVRDLFNSHPISNCDPYRLNLPVGNDGSITAEVFNDFVARFRVAMRERMLLRRELHNWGLSGHQNLQNVSKYLDGLYEKYPSLTVLHMSLYHSKTRVRLKDSPFAAQREDLKKLLECRKRFFDGMRRVPSIFTRNEPNYVWAVQPSLVGGYGLHLTLIFETTALQKVMDDKLVEASVNSIPLADHADMVGSQWVNTATRGCGDYRRGDRNGWLYGPEWVHGEVRADDVDRRGKLHQALGCLALQHALVRLKVQPKGKYFGMPHRQKRA